MLVHVRKTAVRNKVVFNVAKGLLEVTLSELLSRLSLFPLPFFRHQVVQVAEPLLCTSEKPSQEDEIEMLIILF